MSNKNKNRTRPRPAASQVEGASITEIIEDDIEEVAVPTGEAADAEVAQEGVDSVPTDSGAEATAPEAGADPVSTDEVTECEGCGCPDGVCENPPIDLPEDLPTGEVPLREDYPFPEVRGVYRFANDQEATVRSVLGARLENPEIEFALEGRSFRRTITLPLALWNLLKPVAVDTPALREAKAAAEQYRRQLELVAAVNKAAAEGQVAPQEA